MSRLDPKPGRWILPLVVIGLIAFTAVFVNRLPPISEDDEPVSSPTTGAPAPTETTTTQAPVDTTTTTSTIPPEVAAFITAADLVDDEAARLLTEAEEVNAAWEDGGTFTRALNDLQDLEDRVSAFAQSISDTSVPESVAEAWVPVEEAAAEMATAAEEMVAGLRSTDTGQIRRAALADFGTAVESLTLAVEDAKTAAGG